MKNGTIVLVFLAMQFLMNLNSFGDEKEALKKENKIHREMVDKLRKQVATLENVKELLNQENDDLKNTNGKLKANIGSLGKEIRILKGEKFAELTPEQRMKNSLKIIIPRFRMNDTMSVILKKLEDMSPHFDPDQVGIKIRNEIPKDNKKEFNFDFENMPVGEIIRYLCIASGRKYEIGQSVVVVVK